jgi:hypothetical protein
MESENMTGAGSLQASKKRTNTKFQRPEKYWGLLVLVLALTISLTAVFYSLKTNYYLNDDLPGHVAVVKEFTKYPGTDYKNPFIANTGRPDLHAGPYYFMVFIIYKIVSIKSNISLYGLDTTTSTVLVSFILVGIFNVIFFLSSFYILCKTISRNLIFIIAALIALLLIPDIPLIRWAGNISLHGITYQFYYPQFFAISLLLFQLWLAEKYAELSKPKIFVLLMCLSYVLFLSHLLTGLISLMLILLRLCIFNNFKLKQRLQIYASFLALPIIAIFTWPAFPVHAALKSTHTYLLLALLYVAILPGILYQLIKQRQTPKNKINRIQYHEIVAYLSIIIICWIFTYKINLPLYFRFNDVNMWWLVFLPFYPALLLFLNSKIRNNKLLDVLGLWAFGGILIYFLGVIGGPIKVYWRFLLLAKIPLALLLALSWSMLFIRKEFSRKFAYLVLVLIIFGVIYQLNIIRSSPTASYFRNVPYIYKAPAYFSNINNSVILSDPFTSYYIASLSHNTVYSLDPDRASDYDQAFIKVRNKKIANFYNNPSINALDAINTEERINYIVVNKIIKLNKDGTYERGQIDNTNILHLLKSKKYKGQVVYKKYPLEIYKIGN